MEASKVWRVQARVNGLARRRSQRQEDHRVEYVRHLAHQKEPGKSVLAGGLPEISLQIGLLVRLTVDSKIRHHCQVNIPVDRKSTRLSPEQHQKEPGKSVLAGGLPEISLQIGLLVRLTVDSKIRHHCQVNIPVVQKRRFPIDEPDAISVEGDVLRLQIVVA